MSREVRPLSPSPEQQDILNAVGEGKHVMVNAVAGSGKSTTILSLARAFPNRRVLQITYNAMLRHEMKEKVRQYGLENLDIHTFHSLAVKYFVSTAHTDTELRHLVLRRTPLHDPPAQAWDLLVLDEAQDMSSLYFHFICHFLENLGSRAPTQLVVLGDHQQCLYQFKGADVRFLTRARDIWTVPPVTLPTPHPPFFPGEMVTCILQTSYRITTPMAAFVNRAMLGHDRMLAPRDGEPVVYIRNSRINVEKTVVYLIQQLLEQGHAPSDIFILSGSVKGLNSHVRKMENALCERGIPCHIPTVEQDKLDERVIDGKIVFSTFHSVKGRQRKFVFVVGFDHNYFLHMAHGQDPTVCPNTLYVGCTRATERLYLLEFNEYAGDRPLEFLKMSHHDMVAADFVEFRGMPQTLFYDRERDEAAAAGKLKKHYLSPTKLIKFISDPVMDEITPLVDAIFTCIPWTAGSGLPDMSRCDIPSVVQTARGYEDVSDLNGIALPSLFYDHLGGRQREVNILRELIQEAIVDMRDNEHQYLKSIVSELDASERPATPAAPISEYLYLANVYVAIQERLYFKLKQIRRNEYRWLKDEAVEGCLALLDGVLREECTLPGTVTAPGTWEAADDQVWTEEPIFIASMDEEHARLDEALCAAFAGTDLEKIRFRFSAIVDLITPTTVWEIKCTSSITIDHQLQVIIYAWLWGFTGRPPREFKILNLKTGERWVLHATRDQLQSVVVAILKGKYAKIAEKTDEEFLQDLRRKHQ